MSEIKKTDDGKEICPICNGIYKNVKRHFASNVECKEAYEVKVAGVAGQPRNEIDDAMQEILSGRETPATQPAIVPQPAQPVQAPTPMVQRKRIKYVRDLPFDDISGISDRKSSELKAYFSENGYIVVPQLAAAKTSDIEIKGFGLEKIQKVIDMARKELGLYFMTPASEIPSDYDTVTSGVPAIDEITGGGFRTNDSYELFGEYGCGKTQICLQIAINIQLTKDKGGLYDPADPDGPPQVNWLDTERTFDGIRTVDKRTKTSRLMDVAKWTYMKNYPRGENENEADYMVKVKAFVDRCNKNIVVTTIDSSEYQIAIVPELLKRIDGFNFRLHVVDSVISHFRSEYIGRGTLSDRQQQLNKHIHELMKLATVTNAILMVTNQVQANPDGMSYVPIAKATGGNIVAHSFNIRMRLRRGKGGTIVGTLVDASYLPTDKESTFVITYKGIESVGPVSSRSSATSAPAAISASE